MKTSPLLAVGLLAVTGLALGGCTTIRREHKISLAQQSMDCIERTEGQLGQPIVAPQILTYDPYTKIETRQNTGTNGSAATLVAIDRSDLSTSGARIREPGNSVSSCAAYKDRYVTETVRVYPSGRAIGAVVGAALGAAAGASATKSKSGVEGGAAAGAIIGGAIGGAVGSRVITLEGTTSQTPRRQD